MGEQVKEGQKPVGKKAYQRPELLKLGSVRDITMSQSWGGPDGRPHRGTGRGGDF